MQSFNDFLTEKDVSVPDGHYEIRHGNNGNGYQHSIVSGPHSKEQAQHIKTAHSEAHTRQYGLNQDHNMLVRKGGNWHHMHHETGEATEHQAVERGNITHDERTKA